MANYRFPSEHWWPDITSLADSFIDFVNQQTNGNAITLEKKSLEEVKDVYYQNLIPFKKKFYGKNQVGEPPYLDVHKVIALYIKAFLTISPFYLKHEVSLLDILRHRHVNQNNLTEVQLYPNEFFAMKLMDLILISWNESKTPICMEKNEKEWFIGLLNQFRLDIDKLDVLSLASIIYYIEDKYLGSKVKKNQVGAE